MFKLQPKPPKVIDPNWVRTEQMQVTINMPQSQFNRLKQAGRGLNLSMRQIVTQMVAYAEANMSNDTTPSK
jgi:hypothetical protein